MGRVERLMVVVTGVLVIQGAGDGSCREDNNGDSVFGGDRGVYGMG